MPSSIFFIFAWSPGAPSVSVCLKPLLPSPDYKHLEDTAWFSGCWKLCLAMPGPSAPALGQTGEAGPAPATCGLQGVRRLGLLTHRPPSGPGKPGCRRGRPRSQGVSAFSLTPSPPPPPPLCPRVYRTASLDTARWKMPGRRWSSTESPCKFGPAEGCRPGGG